MPNHATAGWMRRTAFAARAFGVAAVAGVLMAAATIAPASAADISPADQQCLACHSMPGLEKTLESGETLSLQVDADHFAPSVHSPLGCTGCHSDVNLASHPPASNPIASKRVFSIAMARICANCHADQAERWSKSVHATLVRNSNPDAPICTSCHSPHQVMKGAAAAIETVPCKNCHAEIFTAYSASVHGILRKGGLAKAPLCFNCHGAHDIDVASAGVGRRDVCLSCHTEAVASHGKWLRNVQLHFDVVSCPACHAPKAQRTIDLILYNGRTQAEISGPVGMPEFEGLVGTKASPRLGLNPTTLLALLKVLNPPGAEDKTSIRGRLEVRTGVQDHQLTFANEAIGTCDTCHREGAAAFQNVMISVAGPSGIPVRYEVDKTVLNSAFSIDSVGGFYAIGGTRIGFLDVLLALALLGGIAWPTGHAIVRWGFGRYLDLTTPRQPKG